MDKKRNQKNFRQLRLIQLIKETPGIHAESLPRHLRCYLRLLEHEGRLEYRDGWYVVKTKTDIIKKVAKETGMKVKDVKAVWLVAEDFICNHELN